MVFFDFRTNFRKKKIIALKKGIKKLRHENRLDFTMKLRDELALTNLDNNISIKSICNIPDSEVEIAIRQILISKIINDNPSGLSFYKSVVSSIGSDKMLNYPLPKKWRQILENKGLKVNKFSSAPLWYLAGLFFWFKGISRGFLPIIKRYKKLQRYVYFANLNQLCISSNPNSMNIINWYLNWSGRKKHIDNICHSVKKNKHESINGMNFYETDGAPYIKNRDLHKYVFFYIYGVICTFVKLIFNPAYGFITEDIFKTKRVSLANKKDLALDYLFNNIYPFYKPIWVNEAERKGANILFYFYSTGLEVISNQKVSDVQYPWHLMTWKHFLTWDSYQSNFINNYNTRPKKIQEVGPIWFSSSEDKVNISFNTIAVFDVTPRKLSSQFHIGLSHEYHSYKLINQFLIDIEKALDKYNMNFAHKMKRYDSTAHKRYLKRIEELKLHSNYHSIHYDIAAEKLIKTTLATISIPFTSTALIADNQKKPSVYYDPSGKIDKKSPQAHGVKIISGYEELERWLETL